jgi:multidrug efflux system outer membrane protein
LQTDWEITNEHLNTLKKHLEIIKNKQRTGSATQYEILSIQVNVSSIETELNEIQSNYGIQLTRLNTLMGTDFKQPVFSADTSLVQGLTLQDSSYAYATFHRNDLLILGKQQDMANINYKRIQSEYLPTIGLFGSGGWNNGYMPEIEQLQANYVVGLSFKMPIFDGNRKNIKLKMAKSDLSQNEYEIENTTRVAMNEISESYSQLQLSTTKIYQSKVQVQQAQEAYNHAEINFKEGAITNLDLIYAEDMLSNSKLQLLKNEIDYQKFLLIFKAALGETIY